MSNELYTGGRVEALAEQTADGINIIEIPGTGWVVDPAQVIEVEKRGNQIIVKTAHSGSYNLDESQGAVFVELAKGRDREVAEFTQIDANIWKRIVVSS